MNRQSWCVGLLVGTSHACGREIWRGIADYVRPRRLPWTFLSVRYRVYSPHAVRELIERGADGIIAELHFRQHAEDLRAFRGPVVNTSGFLDALPFPCVRVDDHAIGTLAARYFLDRGARHFGAVISSDIAYSVRRLHAFREALAAAGRDCRVFDFPVRKRRSPRRVERFIEWLKALPKPAAVMTRSDDQAVEVAELCAAVRLKVPEEIALLGVDNDEILCEFASPPLSSIRVPARQIGLEAARILHHGFESGKSRAADHLLPPTGITERQSTNLLHLRDEAVARAVQYIQDHLRERLRVSELSRVAGICRSLLERRFRAILGRTPLEEIHRARVEHAARLLAETAMPIAQIADVSGFRDAKHLHTLFRSLQGISPSEYRARFQNSK